MEDKDKSREELISELIRLREFVSSLEKSGSSTLPSGKQVSASAADPDRLGYGEFAEQNLRVLEDTTTLLQALNAAQDRFITNGDPKELFDGLLTALLDVTSSQYGFIDEVHQSPDGSPYRQVRSITNIAWNEETRSSYEKLHSERFTFCSLKSLTGAVIVTGKPVIANEPCTDPRRGGLPPGHPEIHAFLGLPLISGGILVGIVGAANRPGGYSRELADFLEPYLNTCANIIMAYRNEQRRKDAEDAVRKEQGDLERRVQERTADLSKTNSMLEQEVAERKRIAQALSESETRYRTVFENAGDAILLLEAEGEHAGRIISANQSAADIHGYTIDELLTLKITDLDPSATPGDVLQTDERLAAGDVVRQEVQHFKKDGTVFPVEKCVAMVLLGDKRYILATDRDITDRKSAEKALRDSEQKHREFAEFLPQIVFELNEQGDFTFINRAGRELGGYPSGEDLTGLNVLELTAPHDRERVARDFSRIMHGENIIGVEYTALKKNGDMLPVVAYMSPLKRGAKIQGVRGVAVDMSDLKAIMHEAQVLRVEAEKASRAKSEFLANMSHELRTPLNAVIGFSEVLEDRFFGPLNETQLKYVGYVVTSGRHLLRLIDDLLDLARIESGRITLQLSQVRVLEMLKSSLITMKETLKEHRLGLELRVTPDLATSSIRADEVRLRQVLFNLLSNATKFTPDEGRIMVKAWKCRDEVIVSVTDTGIGIDPNDQGRIFNIFEQVEGSLSGLRSGTGLGLALTRNLVEMHDGRIWVESPGQGQGSSFTFAIPVCGPVRRETFLPDQPEPREEEGYHDASAAVDALEDSWIRFRILREPDDATCP